MVSEFWIIHPIYWEDLLTSWVMGIARKTTFIRWIISHMLLTNGGERLWANVLHRWCPLVWNPLLVKLSIFLTKACFYSEKRILCLIHLAYVSRAVFFHGMAFPIGEAKNPGPMEDRSEQHLFPSDEGRLIVGTINPIQVFGKEDIIWSRGQGIWTCSETWHTAPSRPISHWTSGNMGCKTICSCDNEPLNPARGTIRGKAAGTCAISHGSHVATVKELFRSTMITSCDSSLSMAFLTKDCLQVGPSSCAKISLEWTLECWPSFNSMPNQGKWWKKLLESSFTQSRKKSKMPWPKGKQKKLFRYPSSYEQAACESAVDCSGFSIPLPKVCLGNALHSPLVADLSPCVLSTEAAEKDNNGLLTSGFWIRPVYEELESPCNRSWRAKIASHSKGKPSDMMNAGAQTGEKQTNPKHKPPTQNTKAKTTASAESSVRRAKRTPKGETSEALMGGTPASSVLIPYVPHHATERQWPMS